MGYSNLNYRRKPWKKDINFLKEVNLGLTFKQNEPFLESEKVDKTVNMQHNYGEISCVVNEKVDHVMIIISPEVVNNRKPNPIVSPLNTIDGQETSTKGTMGIQTRKESG